MYFSIRKKSSPANDADRQPPVFPWESEVADYPETSGDLAAKSAQDEPPQPSNGPIQEDPSS
jgi:hypothetical protein